MKTPVSFEFFPPKTPEGSARLRVARQSLYALEPEFCSVTYGAGGSTHEGTFATVKEILEEGKEAASLTERWSDSSWGAFLNFKCQCLSIRTFTATDR